MRLLRDIARRHSVQVLFVRCGEGLADLRKVTIVARKDVFHLQYFLGRWTTVLLAPPRSLEPQYDSDEGDNDGENDREFGHGLSNSCNRSLNARRRRFNAGDNSR